MKAILRFLFLILTLQCTLCVVAQEPYIKKGRKWCVMSKYLNPYVDAKIDIYVADGEVLIDAKSYTSIITANGRPHDEIRLDGTKIYARMWNDCDSLLFDESWSEGDTTTWVDDDVFDEESMSRVDKYETVVNTGYINGRKYWDLDLNGWKCTWLHGVGYIKGGRWIFGEHNWAVGGPSYSLIYCVEENGDTLYVDHSLIHLTQTGISPAIVEDDVICQQSSDGLWVNLGANIPQWSATLYNSNGVCVAQREGEGSEMFLSTDSKGTHILVVKAGGSVIKKKIALK
jgi:hypothetical protein